jgi:hypothetical protein
MKVVIKNALVDDGYTGTVCFPPKYAKELGLKKRKVHSIILNVFYMN